MYGSTQSNRFDRFQRTLCVVRQTFFCMKKPKLLKTDTVVFSQKPTGNGNNGTVTALELKHTAQQS